MNPNKSFEIDNGLIIDGIAGFFTAPTVPSNSEESQEGSLVVTLDGKLAQRVRSSYKEVNEYGYHAIPEDKEDFIDEGREKLNLSGLDVKGQLTIKGILVLL